MVALADVYPVVVVLPTFSVAGMVINELERLTIHVYLSVRGIVVVLALLLL
jgi:hypothetical protein